MSEITYTLRIQRNTPQADGSLATRWDDFELPAKPLTRILDLLEVVKCEHDGSVTYRQSCRSAICGSCAMKISGKTRLACKTHIGDVADENNVVTLAPMGNQPVLKDLAVNIGKFFKKVHAITPYLEEGAETALQIGADSFDQVNHVTQCIMCGCCYSDCTVAEVSDKFLGPAALAKAFRFVSDPREGQKTGRLGTLSEMEGGVWSCSRCTMCVEVCPKDVKPMEAIVKLRTRAMDKGYLDSVGARHAQAFHGDIQTVGDLNEFTLLQRSVGIAGTIGAMGDALHLMKKGKIPSPFPHKAQDVEELKKIYEHLEKNPVDVETKAIVSDAG
ncbi:succinate dehydrogenase/fumarate reductase iron-sulfur subunit [Magnetofaba australis]|uniref:Fumarate reductase iron-sulfur subunit n=1 Tax=Magnetofaba australis IT-1 TaxID=1434232 RepID=A0A1Y2K1R8_9PROT|nr:2Fe-2S iron-sulfur cluster-binding protein [Magnetofaba australis]OSM00142.1 putative succinate dehydrogenase subunit B [Magnetofaba australis IT-1]